MKTWIPPERFLPYLTWKQVDALPRDQTLLVIPTAAIEQHGHHLPLATDTLINNYLLGLALSRIPKEMAIYALAPVCYGKSNEHVGFPGTLSLSRETFIAVLRDLASSLHAAGFKKIVFFNSHGGNHSLVDVMARDLRAEFGMRVFCLYGGGPASGVCEQEATFGFHAGEVETSILLAATPELVHTDKYTVNYIARVGDPGILKPEFAYATFAWLTRDIAPSGVMGDPNPSTAEKGQIWAEEMSARMASALEEMYRYQNLMPL
jgi:creatinine amidohydrolase